MAAADRELPTASQAVELLRSYQNKGDQMLWAIVQDADDERMKLWALELLRLRDAHLLEMLESYRKFREAE